MSVEVPEGWTETALAQVCKRVRRPLGDDIPAILMISAQKGFVEQSKMYSRFMAGESLKNYTRLRRTEFAYNKGNSKTYPQGCVFRLDDWEAAAVPAVYISFALTSTTVNSDFLAHYFAAGALNRQLARVITSGARSNGLLNISPDSFFACRLKVPPLAEQQKIAAILTAVDDAIRATEAVIAQTRTVKAGLLQDLLTRGIGPDGRPHTELQQTELGPLPMGWTVRPFFDVLDLQHGRAFPSTLYQDHGVALVRPGNLREDNLVVWDQTHTTHVPKRLWDEASRFRVTDGEILMNLTAQSLADGFLGRVCLTPEGTECLLNQRIGRVSAKKGMGTGFAYWALQGPTFRAHIASRGQGSKVQHLYNRDLESAFLPVPSVGEQERISARLFQLHDVLASERPKLTQLKTLKAGLLQDLLTGKVRVTP